MQTVNILEAQTNLSDLVDAAAKGESFIIAKSGKPMVKVLPIDEPMEQRPQRLGWAKDQNWTIPEDFNRWAEDEIREMFEGKE